MRHASPRGQDTVQLARRLAREAGVADRATFVQGDMYEADVSQATVLALFLKPENLDRMRDKFLAMKPGARIVLNTFPLTDWDPDVTETLGPPCRTWCTAMLVIVPARVAGIWQAGDSEMNLTQDDQVVRGTIGARKLIGRLRGDVTSRHPGPGSPEEPRQQSYPWLPQRALRWRFPADAGHEY